MTGRYPSFFPARQARVPGIMVNTMLILKILLAIVLLPVTVTILIPIWILRSAGPWRIGWGLPFPGSVLPAVVGILLIAVGLSFLAGTIRLFAAIGRGTLAPWHPPQSLVIEGPYRFVRNPMITGVLGVLLGEASFFGSLPLFYWFVFAAALNAVYIRLIEEPRLERRFGERYALYKKNVPRWIPRYPSWNGK